MNETIMARMNMIRILILIEICSRVDNSVAFHLVNFQTKQQYSRTLTHFLSLENDDFGTTDDVSLEQTETTFPSISLFKDVDYEYLASIDQDADSISTLESLTSFDRLPEIPTKTEETIMSRVTETASACLILTLGSFATSYLISDLLIKFEWLQDWRYFWPLIGGLYAADPILQRFWKSNPSMLPFNLSKNQGIQFLSIVGGIFTLIGGAYDAFMPVWQTGPNVFTVAGIGQDGAVLLLIVTAVSIIQEKWKVQRSTIYQSSNSNSSNRSLLQILLLAELYQLGESSVDEIVSTVEAIANSLG
ncbi:unnamed protein product [Cylindrotheca closterium]|uniref:Uncharacterized protein n=1 Tax=Cylindrotheca closterium TaxID=2856 RepID=A0AAD2CMB1_9STRA|nr:unnamed protein product [Cylindrotheca closterium]